MVVVDFVNAFGFVPLCFETSDENGWLISNFIGIGVLLSIFLMAHVIAPWATGAAGGAPRNVLIARRRQSAARYKYSSPPHAPALIPVALNTAKTVLWSKDIRASSPCVRSGSGSSVA